MSVQETTTPSVIRESEITKKLSSKHGDFVASFFSSGLWADYEEAVRFISEKQILRAEKKWVKDR